MDTATGAGYKGIVESLAEKIRAGKAWTLNEESLRGQNVYASRLGYRCYFCREHIKGEAKILVEEDSVNGYKSFTYYPVDGECYERVHQERRPSAACEGFS